MVKISASQMNKLANLQWSFDGLDFKVMFGERLGTHLWGKFTKSNSIIHLWSEMDLENQRKFLKFINSKKAKY